MKQNKKSIEEKSKTTSTIDQQPSVEKIVKKQNNKMKIAKILQNIEQQIIENINATNIQIEKIKKPYISQAKQQPHQQKIKIIKMKKRQAINKLYEIEKEEVSCRYNYIKRLENSKTIDLSSRQNLGDNGKSLSNFKRQKHMLNSQDIIKLKKLKQQQINFENNLVEKNKIFYKFIDRIRKEQNQLKEQHIKENCDKKRKQIQKRQIELQKHKNQRIKRFEEEKKALIVLRNKSKLFIEYEERWKRRIEKQEKQKYQKMKILRKNNFSIDQIDEHQQKYKNIVGEKEQQRNIKTSRFNQILHESAIRQKVDNPSKFYIKTLRERKDIKDKIIENQRNKRVAIDRRQDYGERVKQQYLPRVVEKEIEDEQKPKSISSLSLSEIKEIGDRYMKKSISMINKKKLNQDKNGQCLKKEIVSPLSRFKDYLSQQRQFKPEEEKNQGKNKSYKREIGRVKQIMNSNSSYNDKMEYFKSMNSKIQQDRRLNQKQKLMEKIEIKLKLLQSIQ